MLDTGAVIGQLWRPELDARIEASVVLLAELQNAGGNGAASANGAADAASSSSDDDDSDDEAAGPVASSSKANGAAAQMDVDGEADDAAPAATSGDLEATVLRRLIRGLASPRDQARLGFAVALTERSTSIDMHETLTFLHTSTTAPGSAKSAEERDYQFGRLFGLFALLRSGKLFPSSAPKAAAVFTKAFNLALGLMDRSYLRESAGWLVLETIRAFDAAAPTLDWADEGRQVVREGIYGAAAVPAVKAWTPEKIAWTVFLQSHATLGKVDWSSLFANGPAGPTDATLLSEANLELLGRVLKSHFADTTGPVVPTSAPTLTPALSDEETPREPSHYVWSEIVGAYKPIAATDEASAKKLRKRAKPPTLPLPTFVSRVLVDTLMAVSSSTHQQRNGLSGYEIVLEQCDPSLMPSLMHERPISLAVANAKKHGHPLQPLATRLLELIPDVVGRAPSTSLPILRSYFAPEVVRSYLFMTKIRFADRLQTVMAPEDVAQWASMLQTIILERADDAGQDMAEQTTVGLRKWAIDQLGALVIKQGINMVATVDPSHLGWVPLALEFMATHGFFSVIKSSSKSSVQALHTAPSPPMENKVGVSIRDRLFTALAALWQSGRKTPTPADHPVAADWPRIVLRALAKCSKDEKHATPRMEHEDEDARTARADAITLLAALEARTDLTPQLVRIRSLAQAALLISYDHPEEAIEATDESESMLAELADCLRAVASDGTAPIKTDEDDEDDESIDSDAEVASPSAVAVNFIIKLARRKHAFIRQTGEAVFEAYAPEMGEQALSLLFDALVPTPLVPLLETDEHVDVSKMPKAARAAQAADAADASDDGEDDDSGGEGDELDVFVGGADEIKLGGGGATKKGKGKAPASDDEDSSSGSSDDDDDASASEASDIEIVVDTEGADPSKPALPKGIEEDTNFYLDLGEVKPHVKAAVEAALKNAGMYVDPDAETTAGGEATTDDGWASDNEELFDDEQMFQMDKLMAKAFRSEYGSGVRSERAKLAHVRLQVAKQRYVDLLSLYVQLLPSSPHTPHVVRTLFETAGLARPKDENELSEKTGKVLKTVLAVVKAHPLPPSPDPRELRRSLETVHRYARATTGRTQVHYVASATSLYFAALALSIDRPDIITEVYASTLHDLHLTRRSHTKEGVFDDLVQRYPPVAWPLVDACMFLIAGPKTRFHRTRQLSRYVAALFEAALQSDQVSTAAVLARLPDILGGFSTHLDRAATEPIMHANRLRDTLKAIVTIVTAARKAGAGDDLCCTMPCTARDAPLLETTLLPIRRFANSTTICELGNELDALTRPGASRPAPFGPGADRTALDAAIKSNVVGLQPSKNKLKKQALMAQAAELGVPVSSLKKPSRHAREPGQGGKRGPGPRGVRLAEKAAKQLALDEVEARNRGVTVDDIVVERREAARKAKRDAEVEAKLAKRAKKAAKLAEKRGGKPAPDRYFDKSIPSAAEAMPLDDDAEEDTRSGPAKKRKRGEPKPFRPTGANAYGGGHDGGNKRQKWEGRGKGAADR